LANINNKWQHRKGGLEERFGLSDPPESLRFRRQPVFEAPSVGLPKVEERPLRALGLTCGVGSMLVGAKKLGFQILGNFEWRDYYRFKPKRYPSTFVQNFPGAFMARGIKDIPDNLFLEGIDFAAGHPECGRYSILSHSVTRGTYNDNRGSDASDIPLFLDLVAKFKPRFFLMDDLPDSFVAFPMEEYVKRLPEYDLFPEWVSNWGYGNIQKHRNRMFIVGSLKTEGFAFVAQEKAHSKVFKDVVGDLLEIERLIGEIPNHAMVDNDRIPGRYVNLRFYGDRPSWRELKGTNRETTKNIPYFTPDGEEKIRPGTLSPKWDGFSPTLSGGFNPIHPIRRLPISIRERARIQGFPDDFIFNYDEGNPLDEIWEPYCSDGQRGIKQTGKAMPIHFCEYVAAQVRAHIRGEEWPTKSSRILKPNPKVDQAKRAFCELSGYANPEAVAEACWLGEDPSFYASKN